MNRVLVRWLGRILCGGMILCLVNSVSALEPPTPEQIKKYKADGTWEQRVAAAHALGNDRVDPALALRAHNRLRIEASQAAGLPEPTDLLDPSAMGPAAGWGSALPTTGTAKVLVILIDFPDYPHGANQTAADVQSKYFGAGNSARFPYDSLHNYYQRASYSQLDIQGNVLGWYTAPNNRDYYRDLADTTGVGSTALIEEAMNYYNAQGHDFTQYDNNNDGQIDGFYIKWTGPIGGWATFWWAYYTGWGDSSFRIDGKSLGGHTWSWIAGSDTEAYDPQVDIHETGHMLGLPDYYDYNGDVGVDGGVGGLDIMDGNWGDHNCFSKYLLGWLTPIYVVNGTTTLNLRPTGTSQDCVLIMPSSLYTTGTWFDEYYMAQYRSRSAGNDSNFPADGLTIWHIDATGYFSYNNSYTDRKLLRLMEADGEEDIENNRGGDAGDFYKSPQIFGTNTVPNSRTYDGLSTGIFVSQLGATGTTMSANFAITTEPLLAGTYTLTSEDAHPSNQSVDPQERVTLNVTLANVGTTSTTNLVATLLATGGVTEPTGAQTYGATTPGGATVTRAFSFTASGTCGSIITMTLQCQDGATSFPSVVLPIRLGGASASTAQNFDAVTAPARPSGWTATVASGSVAAWATTTAASGTAPNSIFTAAPASISDNRLDSPTYAIASAGAQLTFQHRYNFQSRSDGGVLEISINGGAFTDILSASGNFVTGGYNNTLSSTSNPLGNGRSVWTGNSSTFITTTVNLPPTAVGKSVKFRWRMGSNSSTSSVGWYVDSISLTGGGEPVCSLLSVGDFDGDGDTDQEDFGRFQACFTGNAIVQTDPACLKALMDADEDVDQADLTMFLRCHTQHGTPANPSCRNP